MTIQEWAAQYGFSPSYYGSVVREWPIPGQERRQHNIRVYPGDGGLHVMELDVLRDDYCDVCYGIEEHRVSTETLTLAVRLYCSLYGGEVCPQAN